VAAAVILPLGEGEQYDGSLWLAVPTGLAPPLATSCDSTPEVAQVLSMKMDQRHGI